MNKLKEKEIIDVINQKIYELDSLEKVLCFFEKGINLLNCLIDDKNHEIETELIKFEVMFSNNNKEKPLFSEDEIQVRIWQINHPTGTKKACMDELELSLYAVNKYWNNFYSKK